jgi:hypothetical protein
MDLAKLRERIEIRARWAESLAERLRMIAKNPALTIVSDEDEGDVAA